MRAECPECKDPLSIHGVCGSCGYGREKKKTATYDPTVAHRNQDLVANARRNYLDNGPTCHNLTDQQWYNVCKFWPFVAVHCSRLRPQVGPENALDATAEEGPLFRGVRRKSAPVQLSIEDQDERLALQEEGA